MRRAFTLSELLVVIFIVAILASLLLPALGIVRRQVHSLICRSNLRQIGMAFGCYATDFSGRIASAKQFNGTPIAPPNWGEDTWMDLIQPYVQVDDATKEHSDQAGKVIWGCPVWVARHDISAVTNVRSFGMNPFPLLSAADLANTLTCLDWTNTSKPHTKLTFTSIDRQSQRFLIGDSVDWHLTVDWNWTTWNMFGSVYTSGDPKRHRVGANYLFFDLHVDNVPEPMSTYGVLEPAKLH